MVIERVRDVLRFTLDNPGNGCPAIIYNRAGDRFVSRGWNFKVALFDAVSGRALFTTPMIPPA